MVTKWNIDDYIVVPMKISKIEIIGNKVYYHVYGGDDVAGSDFLIPEEKILIGFSAKEIQDKSES